MHGRTLPPVPQRPTFTNRTHTDMRCMPQNFKSCFNRYRQCSKVARWHVSSFIPSCPQVHIYAIAFNDSARPLLTPSSSNQGRARKYNQTSGQIPTRAEFCAVTARADSLSYRLTGIWGGKHVSRGPPKSLRVSDGRSPRPTSDNLDSSRSDSLSIRKLSLSLRTTCCAPSKHVPHNRSIHPAPAPPYDKIRRLHVR